MMRFSSCTTTSNTTHRVPNIRCRLRLLVYQTSNSEILASKQTHRSNRRRHDHEELATSSAIHPGAKYVPYRNQRPLPIILDEDGPRRVKERRCSKYRCRHTSLERILCISLNQPITERPQALVDICGERQVLPRRCLDRIRGVSFNLWKRWRFADSGLM